MKIGTIIALAAIVTAVGLVGAVNTWLVSQSAKAATCQEFITNGVTTQKCSSDSSDVHVNALNNNAHFKHRNH
jgi:hypothetical protein